MQLSSTLTQVDSMFQAMYEGTMQGLLGHTQQLAVGANTK
jgi:hypothetical protein